MKRTTIYLILTIVFLITLVVLATFALVSPSVSLQNMNISTVTGNNISFTSSGGGNMGSFVDITSMAENNAGNVVATSNSNITVTLSTDGVKPICCDYDIIWSWASTNEVANRYTKTTSPSNEYTLEGYMSETYGSGNTSVSASAKIFEEQLPNYNASSLANTIYSGQICNNTGTLSNIEKQNWNLTTKFYNLSVSQDKFRGVSLIGNVKVGNVVCNAPSGNSGGGQLSSSPTSYWFDINGLEYEFPNYAGTLYTNSTSIDNYYYVGQDNDKYYACMTVSGHEVCLSQPYTQYGLEGHIVGEDFSSGQQASAITALNKVFVDSGISSESLYNCRSYKSDIGCGIGGGQTCKILKNGSVMCGDYGEVNISKVGFNNKALCYKSQGVPS